MAPLVNRSAAAGFRSVVFPHYYCRSCGCCFTSYSECQLLENCSKVWKLQKHITTAAFQKSAGSGSNGRQLLVRTPGRTWLKPHCTALCCIELNWTVLHCLFVFTCAIQYFPRTYAHTEILVSNIGYPSLHSAVYSAPYLWKTPCRNTFAEIPYCTLLHNTMLHNFAQYPPQSLCTLLYDCATYPDPLLGTLPCCTLVHNTLFHTCAHYPAPHLCLIPCSTLVPNTLLYTCA